MRALACCLHTTTTALLCADWALLFEQADRGQHNRIITWPDTPTHLQHDHVAMPCHQVHDGHLCLHILHILLACQLCFADGLHCYWLAGRLVVTQPDNAKGTLANLLVQHIQLLQPWVRGAFAQDVANIYWGGHGMCWDCL